MTDWSDSKKGDAWVSKLAYPGKNTAWPGQAPDGSIGNSITALAKPERKKLGGLGPGRQAQAIGAGESVGKGVGGQAVSQGVSSSDARIIAYSRILVQESGVFELPPGWPDTNTYPEFTFAEVDLPEIGAPYLIQRRTHETVFCDAETRTRWHFVRNLLAYEKPFVTTDLIRYPIPSSYFKPVVAYLGMGLEDADGYTVYDPEYHRQLNRINAYYG